MEEETVVAVLEGVDELEENLDTLYQVNVSDSVTVYTGVLEADALGVARDLVAGCRDDYFFSRLDSDSYFLIIAKGGIDVDTLEASDCVCYQLDYVQGLDDASAVHLSRTEYESVQINNALNLLAYSSIDGYPHLMEGGSYYEFATFALLCVFSLFFFIDRIFSHVGNKG